MDSFNIFSWSCYSIAPNVEFNIIRIEMIQILLSKFFSLKYIFLVATLLKDNKGTISVQMIFLLKGTETGSTFLAGKSYHNRRLNHFPLFAMLRAVSDAQCKARNYLKRLSSQHLKRLFKIFGSRIYPFILSRTTWIGARGVHKQEFQLVQAGIYLSYTRCVPVREVVSLFIDPQIHIFFFYLSTVNDRGL